MPPARRPTADDIPGICDDVAAGASLLKACTERGIHSGHTLALLRTDDRLWANYERARAVRGDAQGHRASEIIDAVERGELEPDRARVMLDGVKWTAGRMAPKLWGDKVSHELGGVGGGPIRMNLTNLSDEQLDQLEALLKSAAVTPAEGEDPA